MERISHEIDMTSRYIDCIGIVLMTNELFKDDRELGEAIRKYVSQCKELYIKDQPFPKGNYIGTNPSDYLKSIKRCGLLVDFETGERHR